MNLLKQSTTVTIRLGPFLDATDAVTEETALGSMGVEISKNHGAFAARNSANATAHDAEGWYSCELNTTDTNTLGKLIVKAHAPATHLPVWVEFLVVPANVYDSLVGGSDLLDVEVAAMAAGVVTAAAIADNAIDAGSIASNAITDAKIATGAITSAKFAAGAIDAAAIADGAIDAGALAADAITAAKLAADVTTELQSGLATAAALATVDTVVDAIQAKTDNLPSDPADESLVIAATDAIFARIGAPVGASISADIAVVDGVADAIKAKTDNLPSDPADASVIAGRFDTVDASLADLPTNAELAAALASADDAVLAAIAALNNLSQADVRTAVGLASANLDTQLSAVDDYVDTEIAALVTAVAAVNTLATAIKAKTDSLTFSIANRVSANITHVIGSAVQENGDETTNWGGPP